MGRLQRSQGSLTVRTFLRQQKTTLQTESADSAWSSPVLPVPGREGAMANASHRFIHDFSLIPLHSTTLPRVQPKLEINAPGDRYEQEAERAADEVMRMRESCMALRSTA